jgi:hypothetical protein
MKYSSELPNEPGYYWLKRGDEEEVVEIWTDPNNPAVEKMYYVHHCGSGSAIAVGTLENAVWAGPIPKPIG